MENYIGYYQTALFLSSDFFLSYWARKNSLSLDQKTQLSIQQAYRHVVLDFMQGQEVFWNIRFDTDSVEQVKSEVTALVESSPQAVRPFLMATAYLFNEHHSAIDMASHFLWRVGSDPMFCTEQGVSAKTHETIYLCLETRLNEPQEVWDMPALWESAETPWDNYLKSLTPDQPQYLCDTFMLAHTSANTLLPLLNAMAEVISPAEQILCLEEVAEALLRYYPAETCVQQAVQLLSARQTIS